MFRENQQRYIQGFVQDSIWRVWGEMQLYMYVRQEGYGAEPPRR